MQNKVPVEGCHTQRNLVNLFVGNGGVNLELGFDINWENGIGTGIWEK